MHLGGAGAVARDAEESHLAAVARFPQRVQSTAGTERRLPLGLVDQVVELDQVDPIDAQALERPSDALARALGRALAGLRGQEEAITVTRHPRPDAQLRVAVGRRRIDVVDAVGEQQLEDLIGLLLAHRAERRGAEEHAARAVSRAPEGDAVHGDSFPPISHPLGASTRRLTWLPAGGTRTITPGIRR